MQILDELNTESCFLVENQLIPLIELGSLKHKMSFGQKGNDATSVGKNAQIRTTLTL